MPVQPTAIQPQPVQPTQLVQPSQVTQIPPNPSPSNPEEQPANPTTNEPPQTILQGNTTANATQEAINPNNTATAPTVSTTPSPAPTPNPAPSPSPSPTISHSPTPTPSSKLDTLASSVPNIGFQHKTFQATSNRSLFLGQRKSSPQTIEINLQQPPPLQQPLPPQQLPQQSQQAIDPSQSDAPSRARTNGRAQSQAKIPSLGGARNSRAQTVCQLEPSVSPAQPLSPSTIPETPDLPLPGPLSKSGNLTRSSNHPLRRPKPEGWSDPVFCTVTPEDKQLEDTQFNAGQYTYDNQFDDV
uniref:Uncharacterized protein n=1 Tax=Arcella intermedia TaxID=1963864 RepID=A0A6B2LA81_9EUKA